MISKSLCLPGNNHLWHYCSQWRWVVHTWARRLCVDRPLGKVILHFRKKVYNNKGLVSGKMMMKLYQTTFLTRSREHKKGQHTYFVNHQSTSEINRPKDQDNGGYASIRKTNYDDEELGWILPAIIQRFHEVHRIELSLCQQFFPIYQAQEKVST
jgi:hypothetical protein